MGIMQVVVDDGVEVAAVLGNGTVLLPVKFRQHWYSVECDRYSAKCKRTRSREHRFCRPRCGGDLAKAPPELADYLNAAMRVGGNCFRHAAQEKAVEA